MWNTSARRWKGELISDLVSTLRAEGSFSPIGTLFIAAVESRYISLARFLDRGSYIAFAQPDYEKYRDTLIKLWGIEPLSSRWDEMHYLVRGGDTRITHLFPEDIETDVPELDRWRGAAKATFGVKKIVFPHGRGRAEIR